MSWAIMSLLVGALGLTTWLHGGHHFAVLTWPAGLAVASAFVLAATGQLHRAFRPANSGALWGWMTLLGLAFYALWRWEALGTPAGGFLPVLNLVLGALACGAVLWGQSATAPRLALAMGIILVAGLQFAQIGLWRTGTGAMPAPWFVELLKLWYQDQFDPRMSGFFINRNHLAWLLNAACLLSASLCVWARLPAGVKFLFGWISAIFALGTLLVLSRGGALGLAGGLIVFLLGSLFLLARARGRSRSGVLVVLGVLIVSLVGATSYLVATDTLVQERIERVNEDFYREQTWQAGWRQWQIAPWLGTGPGSATDYARTLRPVGLHPNEALHLHNDWLELLAEGGLVGLGLAALSLGFFLWAGIAGAEARLRARPPMGFPQSTEAALSLGAVAVLAAMAVHSFFDFNLQLGANALLAFLMLGLAGAGGGRLDISRWWGRGLFLVGVAGVAGFLWWSTPPWRADWGRVQMTNFAMRGQVVWPPPLVVTNGPAERGQDALWMVVGDFWMSKAQNAQTPEDQTEALTQALQFYGWAAEANPLDRTPFLRLASARAIAGGWFFAYVEAVQGVERDAMSGFVYEVLGGVRETTGDWDTARRAYTLAMQFRQSSFLQSRRDALQEQEKAGEIPPPAPLPIWKPEPAE